MPRITQHRHEARATVQVRDSSHGSMAARVRNTRVGIYLRSKSCWVRVEG